MNSNEQNTTETAQNGLQAVWTIKATQHAKHAETRKAIDAKNGAKIQKQNKDQMNNFNKAKDNNCHQRWTTCRNKRRHR